MKRSEEAYRVAVVPVRLSTTDYRQAHAACHRAAGLWNHTTTALGEYWETHSTDPTVKELRHLAAASEPELQHLHAHTKQAIVDDVLDAVHTSRTNKARHPRTFATARAPWRVKQYRPLSFTRNYGWHVLNGNRINLSFGRGRPGLKLPLPTVIDSRTGVAVPADRWGEIRLCWDRNARQWSLHIAYQTLSPAAGDPTRFVGIDPGIINPMTVAVETPTEYTVTVINGRHARALKHRRNTAVSALRTKMARCATGSRQHRRYTRALKRVNAHARSGLHNIDHQVSRKAARIAAIADAGTIAVGDVRGIEKATRQAEKRRFGKDQRRRLSQWSRGRQEKYLSEKTGSPITHVNEAYSSKTCPACLTRNAPIGRHYQCHNCGFTCHRDAVGAINILMRAQHGKYTPIDTNKPVRVIYLRATPLQVAPSTARNRATGTPCVAKRFVHHAAATGPTSPAGLTPVAA